MSALNLSFHTCWPSIWGQLPHDWFPYKSTFPLASGKRGKKGLISPSLVTKSPSIFLLSHPLGTVDNILTFAHMHTHIHTRSLLIQSPQIQLTWCKVSWKTDVAGVTYRNLLIAFHCLTFPFIHSNPLTMELRDVRIDLVSLHELEESGFWSQRSDVE